MARDRLLERLKVYLDPIDISFGILPGLTGCAAFSAWARVIVSAIRGEEVEEDWRFFVSTAAFIATRTLVSGTHVRETIALRSAAVEMRELVRDAARRRSAEIACRRPGSSRFRTTRALYRGKTWLVALAALTLAAAVVTLVVSIVA